MRFNLCWKLLTYNRPKLPFFSQAQLEKMVTKLKVEKAQVEASLREEEAKCGMLLKEVKDANEARQSLEKLLSNVKGDSIELENRLQSESLTRTQHEREAEEHKELWEAEVRSRTKLGAKVRYVCFTNTEI
ncbi:uncharacterized protein LOC110055615 [Orbicella faveolata]|uniref:uncharacterized protein LOC110055615 n=1 Tax=Orbicella faveolata TaxID=48498 RepID=UPI0009E522E8|nr:uncharacterized protein LOC110055615 [Orbicella faveolata]